MALTRGSSKKPAHTRVLNAYRYSCLRCRQQKIKCTGGCPCGHCERRNVQCIFEGEESKVWITRKHLSELKLRLADLEKENRTLKQQLSERGTPAQSTSTRHGDQETPKCRDVDTSNEVSASPMLDINRPSSSGDPDDLPFLEYSPEEARMVNPLSTGPPQYVMDTAGNPYYLGHTSNWSLTLRFLHLTHQRLYGCPFPNATYHMDASVYDLGWDGTRATAIPDITGLPSLDHCLFLINATKFHTGQTFHLFDEKTFMPQLYDFYENPAEKIHSAGTWFIHFLVIIALGKAFVGAKSRGNFPQGGELFTRAFVLLPEYSHLWRDPATSGELLCSMAIYLQCIDWRACAHNLIGQALRIMLAHGMHADIRHEAFDKHELERYRKIWWTVYILDRQLSVLMGLPLSILDDEISAKLPIYLDPTCKMAVPINVKLCHVLGQVVNRVYGKYGRCNTTFFNSTQKVLQGVAAVGPEIREFFPIPEDDALRGISRVSGYINLLYHQCIMLSTRPFLFILLERHLESIDDETVIPPPVKLLLQICVESAKKTVSILQALQGQSLLESFLPFDLDSTVSSGMVILIAATLGSSLIEDSTHYRQKVFSILNEIMSKRNLIAEAYYTKLKNLDSLLAKHEELVAARNMAALGQASGPANTSNLVGSLPSGTSNPKRLGLTLVADDSKLLEESIAGTEDWEWNDNLMSSQLMTAVDLLDTEAMGDWATFPANMFTDGPWNALGSERTPPGQ